LGLKVPVEAMGWRETLEVYDKCEELRQLMVIMNELPPPETEVDGSSVYFPSNGDDVLEGLRKKQSLLYDDSLERYSEENIEKNKETLLAKNQLDFKMNGMSTVLFDTGNVQKTGKSGTRNLMRAIVGMGDKKGTGGVGVGKAPSVQLALSRACNDAAKNLLFVPKYGCPHRLITVGCSVY